MLVYPLGNGNAPIYDENILTGLDRMNKESSSESHVSSHNIIE
jgi:hypothetical protein